MELWSSTPHRADKRRRRRQNSITTQKMSKTNVRNSIKMRRWAVLISPKSPQPSVRSRPSLRLLKRSSRCQRTAWIVAIGRRIIMRGGPAAVVDLVSWLFRCSLLVPVVDYGHEGRAFLVSGHRSMTRFSCASYSQLARRPMTSSEDLPTPPWGIEPPGFQAHGRMRTPAVLQCQLVG